MMEEEGRRRGETGTPRSNSFKLGDLHALTTISQARWVGFIHF
jgi:hypothetical protein